MDKEKPVLIETAAEQIGVSTDVVLRWIQDGRVQMVHPNYVLMSDVRRAYIGFRNREGHKFLKPRGSDSGFKLLGNE